MAQPGSSGGSNPLPSENREPEVPHEKRPFKLVRKVVRKAKGPFDFSKIQEAVAEMFQRRKDPASAPSQQRASLDASSDASWDGLAADLKLMIWNMLASTPSWVHFKFEGGVIKPVDLENLNRYIYVSKAWLDSPELWKGLSRTQEQDKYGEISRYIVDLLEGESGNKAYGGEVMEDAAKRMQEKTKYELSEPPFGIELDGELRHPQVRRRIDWFHLENHFEFFHDWSRQSRSSETYPDSEALKEVAICVFGLQDIYLALGGGRSGMRQTEPWETTRPADPAQFFDNMHITLGPLISDYTVEECKILVGDTPKNVQPWQMEELEVQWIEGEAEPPHGRRPIATEPMVHEDDRDMIRFVQQEMEYLKKAHREYCFDHLTTVLGQDWLRTEYHGSNVQITNWMLSPEGTEWREETDDGRRWTSSTDFGWWWLASDLGSQWLETKRGLDWLNGPHSKDFLESPQAKVWVRTPCDEEEDAVAKEVPPKAWFQTEAGQKWKSEKCKDGLTPVGTHRPAFPRPPQGMLPLPVSRIPTDIFFIRPPPAWRFIQVGAENFSTGGEGRQAAPQGQE